MFNNLILWATIILIFSAIGIFGSSLIYSFITRVPYLPSRKKNIKLMLDLITNDNLSPIVFDLGCGDGKILFQIEKERSIAGIGYEISPLPYLLAVFKKLIFRYKSKIIRQDLFKADLSKADYIFVYLTPRITKKLATKIALECKTGTVVISNTFTIPNLNLINTIPGINKSKIYVYQV
jgi:SAM-dependent methyltransferase